MRLTAEQKKQKATRLYEVLVDLKEKCDNGNFRRNNETIRAFLHNNGFTNSKYSTAMFGLNILYRDDFYITRWKENIPVTKKLATTIINKTSEMDAKYTKLRKLKGYYNVKPKVKAPIFDKRIVNGGNSTKLKGIDRRKKEFKDIPKVGLIRRFLRWLY